MPTTYAIKDPNAPITESQAKYLMALFAKAYANDAVARATALSTMPSLTKGQASAAIDKLKIVTSDQPFATVVPSIPASTSVDYTPPLGHYWVDGKHVTIKKSKYKTQTYLYVNDHYFGTIGASSKAAAYLAEHFPNADVAHRHVLEYSKVTSKCGVCNTKLTDPKSIAAGIGPVCAKKFGK